MSLQDLALLRRYRTGRQNLVTDFYVPCLSEATLYRRAVGYFTSGALALSAQGLSRLVDRGGAVQLVASPQFQAEDIEALRRGLEARDDVVERALLRELVGSPLAAQQHRLELVAWLLAEQHLTIKIAVMAGDRRGIFHEKIGLLSDLESVVAFSGSANETEAAHVGNFESFSVYKSWNVDEKPWVDEIDKDFDDLWRNDTPELDVFRLPEALAAAIIRAAPADNYAPLPDPEDRSRVVDDPRHPMGLPSSPPGLSVRTYQRDAPRAWFEAGGKGIFEMATGTGKTITALTLVQELRRGLNDNASLPLVLLVVCPFVNLVAQWGRELTSFGVRPIIASESADGWRQPLQDVLTGVRLGAIDFAAVVTTNSTLAGKAFQGLIAQMPRQTLVVADEVHNLGTARLAASLPEAAAYRLGLSATPDRWMDDEGSQRIRDYFGPSVYQLSLQTAIAEGHLCNYDYHPLIVSLTDDERDRYLELSLKIARLAAIGNGELSAQGSSGALQLLLFERSRLVGAARNKLSTALAAARSHKGEGGLIVYCSDGSDYGAGQGYEPGLVERQINQVVEGLCMPPVSIAAARYTYNETPRARAGLERQFAEGVVDALVAIRCLDEGVDIPSMKTAIIMASTTNPRQFVQRRGRVLRRHPGKDKATIYDLVVSPGDPSDLPPEVYNVERRIFRRELVRVVEFARSAENSSAVMRDLLDLRTAWNCLDVWE